MYGPGYGAVSRTTSTTTRREDEDEEEGKGREWRKRDWQIWKDVRF